MAEGMAGSDHLPGDEKCLRVYREWAKGGWGLVITGNLQIDSDYLGGKEDYAIDPSIPDRTTFEAWKAWAEVCSQNGTKAIVQLCHPGRQTPFGKNTPIAPSAVPLELGSGVLPSLISSVVFKKPREITLLEIQQVIQQFAHAARLASSSGFAGVEIHGAHGYLLSQFLSPKSNRRSDAYGGTPLKRARLALEVIHAVRAAVPKGFCVGIKLNSVDYQSETDLDACIVQLRAIVEAGVDFIEISGGSFEDPLFNTGPADATKTASASTSSKSTSSREAFFLEFAKAIREESADVPLIVTGGFRTRSAMHTAITEGSCDLVGIARPATLDPKLPRTLLLNPEISDSDAIAAAPKILPPGPARFLKIKAVGVGAETGWYTKRLHAIGNVQGSVVITGSNGGLGRAMVKRILGNPVLSKCYHGIYTVRSLYGSSSSHVGKILERKKRVDNGAQDLLALDLTSLASVRQAAERINKGVADGSIPPIKALILNAGYQEQATQTITEDGFDMSFQVNYLAHFLFTLLLLKSLDRTCGRIVLLGSWTHDTAHPNNKLGGFTDVYSGKYEQIMSDYDDSTERIARGTWSSEKDHPGNPQAGLRRYGAAKLCEVMMFRELSARIAKDTTLSQISVLCVDPGAMPSELTRRDTWYRRVVISKFMLSLAAFLCSLFWPNGPLRTTRKSAKDVLRAAGLEEGASYGGQSVNGLYLSGSEVSGVSLEAEDAEKRERLWRESVGYAQITREDTILKAL
ncbi:NADH:flavin oxidoreductase / NADH oxidase family protein [Sarocladium implicatum]|nr:NADH:flavin oxidoreductase / NADH oxidase family protein [Sarocladium implicatum]